MPSMPIATRYTPWKILKPCTINAMIVVTTVVSGIRYLITYAMSYGGFAMSEPVNPRVVDLSHWDPAHDYEAVLRDGIVGVIYKATEGQTYTDDTYVSQQKAAKAVGLEWGAYHFADGSDVDGQVENFLRFACPDEDELFALDWEDNPSGAGKMSLANVKAWISKVEEALERPGECVIYGGNTLKEALSKPDAFLNARRLWLCQYGANPSLPPGWDSYWLWQFTDGQAGPSPHSVDGIGPCDINSYAGATADLVGEWASGSKQPKPEPSDAATVHVNVQTTGEVFVSIALNGEVIYGD
jgi:lysozyme